MSEVQQAVADILNRVDLGTYYALLLIVVVLVAGCLFKKVKYYISLPITVFALYACFSGMNSLFGIQEWVHWYLSDTEWKALSDSYNMQMNLIFMGIILLLLLQIALMILRYRKARSKE